jgi:hypothetical protein
LDGTWAARRSLEGRGHHSIRGPGATMSERFDVAARLGVRVGLWAAGFGLLNLLLRGWRLPLARFVLFLPLVPRRPSSSSLFSYSRWRTRSLRPARSCLGACHFPGQVGLCGPSSDCLRWPHSTSCYVGARSEIRPRQPNKRTELAGTSVSRNVGLCAGGQAAAA